MQLLEFTGPGSESMIRFIQRNYNAKEGQMRILFEQPQFDVWAHRNLIPAMLEQEQIDVAKFCVERLLQDAPRVSCTPTALGTCFQDDCPNSCNLLLAYLHNVRRRFGNRASGPTAADNSVIEWLLQPSNRARLGIDINACSLSSGRNVLQLAWNPTWVAYLLNHGSNINIRSLRGWTAIEEAAGDDVVAALLEARGEIPLKDLVSGKPGACSSYMGRVVWSLKESSESKAEWINLIAVTHIDEILPALLSALSYSNLIGYDHFIRIFSVIFRKHAQSADPGLRRPANRTMTVGMIEELSKRVRKLTVKAIDGLVSEMKSLALKVLL